MSKVGRNDPCTCGSGKKYKKCCGFNTAPTEKAESPNGEALALANRQNLDAQLAKYAPTVTVADVEKAIKGALDQGGDVSPMAVIETVFNDDNLTLSNRRHADRLFKAFMTVWNDIAQAGKGTAAE